MIGFRISSLKRLSLCLMGTALLSTSILNAAVPEEKEKEIKASIEKDLTDALDKLVDNKMLAARYEFDYPVQEPAKTLAAVQGIVDKAIVELAKKKHPKSWINEELKKAQSRYELWSEGDKVTGKTKDGGTFSGYLRRIQSTSILIDTKRIYYKDLTPETYVHMNAQKAKELKTQIRNRLVSELIAKRTRYARTIRLDQTREIYKQHGYIRVSGMWKPKAEFFRTRIASEREKYKTLIAQDVVYKHYYKAGYRLFRGEWYTPEEVVKLRTEALVEDELAPKTLMALLDRVNKEGREGSITGDVEKLFGDDDDDDGKANDKKEEEDVI